MYSVPDTYLFAAGHGHLRLLLSRSGAAMTREAAAPKTTSICGPLG